MVHSGGICNCRGNVKNRDSKGCIRTIS